MSVLASIVVQNRAAAQAVPRLTPQQQQILYLRALQMRGRGQVRTGYPQDIQMGPGVGTVVPQEQPPDTTQKSSTQKRIEARKAREEQKRIAREAAEAKKAKAVKKPAKDDAVKAVKKPAKDTGHKGVAPPKKSDDEKTSN